MLVVGLTGGIGSGKSTVANFFGNKGIKIIDADQLSRNLTQPGQEPFKKIVAHFGPNILLPEGTLNRKLLRTLIFSNKRERLWLEELLHPLIRIEMEKEIQSAESPYIIIVIPLLFETKPNPLIQRILVVDTTEEQQLERIQKRDLSSLAEAKAILSSQVSRQHRLNNATEVIHNTGSIDHLQKEVDKLHNFYLLHTE